MSDPDISDITDKLGPKGMVPGWLLDDEDESFYGSLPELPEMGEDFIPVQALPFYKDPYEWLKIEDQNGFGSCQGHALTSCMEICYFYQTGVQIQLSRWYAYIKTQLVDGIRGDRGSTIGGGAKVATNNGVPLEDYCPYPRSYSQKLPAIADQKAGEYKLSTAYSVPTWKAAKQALAAGVGAINIGIPWNGGGHAICLFDPSGRFANSHGTRYQDRGFGRFTEDQWERLFRHSFTRAFMLSDMVGLEPREVAWTKGGGGWIG